MVRFLLLSWALHLSYFSNAQSPVWNELKKKYPDESAVFLTRDKVVTLEIKGDSLLATAEMNEKVLFLKDRPDDTNDMRIFGSHFQEIEDVQAKTLVWEKSKYKDLPLAELTRKREDDNSVFYDDSYFYHLSFPAAHAGNQAVWSYKERFRDPRFLPSFTFQDYLPQIRGSLVLRAPAGVEIKWHILNDEKKSIQFKKYTKGSLTYYEWSAENIPAYKREARSPSYSYFVPLVVFHVTSWKNNNGTQTLLASLDDLNRWYSATLQSVHEDPTPELNALVQSMVLPSDSEMEKVRKVFYWVQDNIRYVAFEDGMRGLVPHKPSYVLEKRYGDCKDMASLIVGMLKAAGVKSYYTWIGTRDIPYRYTFIPSPLVDNHMIATYIDADQNYFFLDGTSNYTPLPYPSSMIQGKEAFISFSPTRYEVKEVPGMQPNKNIKADSVELTINNGTLVGKGKVYLTGYQKIEASYDINKTVATKQKENVVSWVRKGSNKFFLDDYQITHLSEKDSPLLLNYDFRVSDYVTYVGNEIYVNLNLTKSFYNALITDERKAPVENDYEFVMDDVYSLSIPEGYELEYLPPNTNHKGDLLSFDLTYHQSEKVITLHSKLVSSCLLISPDQFDAWNQAIKELSAAYKESIIFKKKTP